MKDQVVPDNYDHYHCTADECKRSILNQLPIKFLNPAIDQVSPTLPTPSQIILRLALCDHKVARS